MLYFWLAALVLISAYYFWIGLFYYGWERTPSWHVPAGDNKYTSGISVVIPCRNEESNISLLLAGLVQQNYPSDLIEIIIIDDHSSDQTPAIVKKYANTHKNIIFAGLPRNQKGKKAALRLGIEKAGFSYILTTDADCVLPRQWIRSMAGCLLHSGADLIAGPVILKGDNSFFSKFQQLEHLSLQGSTAGAIKTGNPVMCSSANLGFKKETYIAADDNGKDKIVSGDDVFFLLAVHQSQGKIVFLKSRDAYVETNVMNKLRDFFRQRLRWASKSRLYTTKASVFTAFLVFIVHFYALICLFGAFFLRDLLSVAALMLVSKSFIDFPFLYSVTRYFKKTKIMLYFPVVQCMYFFYVTFTAITSLTGKFSWKGRTARY